MLMGLNQDCLSNAMYSCKFQDCNMFLAHDEIWYILSIFHKFNIALANRVAIIIGKHLDGESLED